MHKIIQRLAMVSVASVAALAATTTVATASPTVSAHRGGGKQWPAASAKAYSKAIASGITDVEGDAMPTRDGKFVMFHDSNFGSNCSGPYKGVAVHKVTQAQALKMRCNGQPVMSTNAYLDLVKHHPKVTARLEAKEYGKESSAAMRTAAYRLTKLVKSKGMTKQTILQSFSFNRTSPQIHKANKKQRISALAMEPTIKRVKEAAAAGAYEFSFNQKAIDRWMVAYIRDHGMRPVAWTDDTKNAVRVSKTLGVKTVISNYPTKARSYAKASTCGHYWHNTANRTVWSGNLKKGRSAYFKGEGTKNLSIGQAYGLNSVTFAVYVSKSSGHGSVDLAPQSSWLGHAGQRAALKGGKQRLGLKTSPGDHHGIRITSTGEAIHAKVVMTGYSVVDC